MTLTNGLGINEIVSESKYNNSTVKEHDWKKNRTID